MEKYYPNTSITIQEGDLLYSYKINRGTLLVGHLAFLGPNGNIFHVNQVKPNGHVDSLERYSRRHVQGDQLHVLRPNLSSVNGAIEWAQENIHKVKYYIYTWNLKAVSNNYCSKFIWQAFWHGEGIDVTGRKLKDNSYAFIFPKDFVLDRGEYFTKKGTFSI